MRNSAGSGKVLFSAVVITLALSLCATPPAGGAPLDPETETNVANALWMLNYDPARIPHDIAVRLASPINADTAFGSRFKAYLLNLVTDPTTFTPDYSQYYSNLEKLTSSLTPRQQQGRNSYLGNDLSRGFLTLPQPAPGTLQFPHAHGVDPTAFVRMVLRGRHRGR